MKGSRLLLSLVLLAIAAVALLLTWKYLVRKGIAQYVEKQTILKGRGKGLENIVNPDDVVEIRIRNPSGKVTLEKDEKGVWYVTEPVQAVAEKRLVSRLPIGLLFVEENRIVEKNPQDLSKYYLDNPDVEVKFKLKGESKWHTLQFGRRSPLESLYYTFNPETRTVFLTEFTTKFDFNGNYDQYINKIVFLNSPAKANRAVFEFSDKTYEFILDQKVGYWFMQKPIPAKVHKRRFQAMLEFFESFSASRMLKPGEFPLDTGLDKPELKITFSRTGEWVETLIMGKEINNMRYAKVGNDPAVFLVNRDIIETIRNGLDSIGTYLAIFFPQLQVKRIEFIQGEKSFTFYHENRDAPWTFVDHPDAKVDESALMNLIFKIRAAENKGYTGASMPGAGNEYGLDKPRITIKMEFFVKQYAPLNLYYGDKDPSGKYLFMYNSQDPNILKVDAIFEKIIPKSPEALLQ